VGALGWLIGGVIAVRCEVVRQLMMQRNKSGTCVEIAYVFIPTI
jgi:hypothetical protein